MSHSWISLHKVFLIGIICGSSLIVQNHGFILKTLGHFNRASPVQSRRSTSSSNPPPAQPQHHHQGGWARLTLSASVEDAPPASAEGEQAQAPKKERFRDRKTGRNKAEPFEGGYVFGRVYESVLPPKKDAQSEILAAAECMFQTLANFRLGEDAKGCEVVELFNTIKNLPIPLAKSVRASELGEKLQCEAEKRLPLTSLSPFHVHIGAGRLGLGLVIPAVAKSKTPLAILQRPSDAWSPVFPEGPQFIDVMVNNEVVCPQMRVVRDMDQLPVTKAKTIQENLFVVTENTVMLQLLLSTATSFSMSLGPYMMEVVHLLEHLPSVDDETPKPILYAAENDHKMVEEVAASLKGKVEVCTVMVDRICVERKISEERVAVVCEPYEGEMVVILQNHPPAEFPVPFKGNHVRVPDQESEADYFCRRKFLLVNGSHTTLAFLTLCLRQPKEKGKKNDVTEPGDHLLISWDTKSCGKELHREIWAWAVARLLILLSEYEIEDLRHAHGVETDEQLVDLMLEYATETLNRFASTKDTTGRVLQGGVANRWDVRLKQVDTFLQTSPDLNTPIARILLEKTGVELPYMKEVVSRLCNDSERFALAEKAKLAATAWK